MVSKMSKNNKVSFTIVEHVDFTDVFNMLCDAYETSAINYWGLINAYDWGDKNIEKLIERRGRLSIGEIFAYSLLDESANHIVYDVEENQKMLGFVNIEKIKRAITFIASQEGLSVKALIENYDGDLIDKVFQYALFGELIYG